MNTQNEDQFPASAWTLVASVQSIFAVLVLAHFPRIGTLGQALIGAGNGQQDQPGFGIGHFFRQPPARPQPARASAQQDRMLLAAFDSPVQVSLT